MKVKEALEKMNWEVIQLNGLTYKSETVLGNPHNNEFLNEECEIEEHKASQPWEEDEIIIRLRRGGDPIVDCGWMGAMESHSGSFRKNGLILG